MRTFITRRARRDLEQLPEPLRDAVDAEILRIGVDPDARGKRLRGRLEGLRSARVGSRRIIYRTEGDEAALRVVILAIPPRRTAYRTRPR